MSFVTVQGRRIEYEFIEGSGRNRPTIVFLHEGLGSIAMWKDFPARVVEATGCKALVYSRYGYGQSDALSAARRVDYMHEEAQKALPEFLEKLDVQAPVLLGHSDGGSIALIRAGTSPGAVAGVIAMAPHVMVEDRAIAGIKATKHAYDTSDLREKLSRYHASPDSAFRGWSDIWLAPDFRAWSIEEFLPDIACPVLAIQGENDEYGTLEQIDRIARGAADVELLKLGACGHSPHRDQPDKVISAVKTFIDRMP